MLERLVVAVERARAVEDELALWVAGQTNHHATDIPALKDKEKVEISATTKGRAIFSAYTVGVSDWDNKNNRKEVNTLISHS